MSPGRRLRLSTAGVLAAAQRGQAIAWTAVMLPLFLAVVGLAADGGLVFGARREIQNVADSAARAGAQQIDVRVYRESRGRTVVLDQSAARRAAAEHAERQGSDLKVRIEVDPNRVRVEAARDAHTSFLRLIGIGTVQVSAAATAEVRHGIERGDQ
ncbi:MAG: pilus assembly protein TadG-related protein [Chloroflexota bacterium]